MYVNSVCEFKMSMELQPSIGNDFEFDRNWLEEIILNLADAFHIRIVWNRDSAIWTGALAVTGTLIGGFAGGRMGAALGAGIGGATGYGIYTVVTLREIWATIKEKLTELFYIVFNYLRRLDPIDYINAFEVLMDCRHSRTQLVYTILDFITHKLGRQALSSITAA